MPGGPAAGTPAPDAMHVFRHFDDLTPTARGAVVVLGNFDGVHRGHQAVIAQARTLARAAGAPLAVLTFEPHPRTIFQPDAAPFRLTAFRTRTRHLEALGVDVLVVLRFDAAFSRMTAEAFVADVLHGGLGARHVVIGHDFRFGHKRLGTPALLTAHAQTLGFAVTIIDAVRDPGNAIFSSTLIRRCLRQGDPARAAALLGHLWEVEGRVIPGDRRGRTLGYPTANLELGDYLRPAYGVYAVRAGIDAGAATAWHDGVASLGIRPTVGGKTLLLEVHLFDFSGDLYGRHLRVAFVDYLRPEIKFDTLPALEAKMAEDSHQAREILRRRAAAPAGARPPVFGEAAPS